MSAVAYCMGQTLYKELNIPIGLIVSAKGAMSAQAFTAKETLQSDTELYNKYLKPYEDGQITDPGAVPCQLYNGIIYPFRKLSMKGFGWYQGENNAGDGPIYAKLCAEMVKGWRKAFNQDDLPYYYVQVAPYNFGGSFFSPSYANLREAQGNIRNLLSGSDMVVTLDLGYPVNIHPANKRPVGERLAALALKETYGQTNKIAYGPRYQSMVIDGGKVVIKYDPVSTGTGISTKDGKTPNHFFIAGSDKKFYLAAATIVGNEIHLTAPEVNAPIAARYAYLTYPVTNFQNAEGFPAEPFRTDSWTPYESTYDNSRGGNDKQSLTVRDDGTGNYPTITSAMYDATPGDTIDILGTFTETLLITKPLKSNIVFKGHGQDKTIMQQTTVKPEAVSGMLPVIRIGNGLDITFADMTIRYGGSPDFGGGIFVSSNTGGKVKIIRCAITNNIAGVLGGGIASLGSNIEVVDCSVTNNIALTGGGGIFTAASNAGENSTTLVDRCLIAYNKAAAFGAGVYADGNDQWGNEKTLQTIVRNTTVAFNEITNSNDGLTSGIFLKAAPFVNGGNSQSYSNHRCRIINSTIAYNKSGGGGQSCGSGIGASSGGSDATKTRFSIYNSVVALNQDNKGVANTFADIHFSNLVTDTTAYCLFGTEHDIAKAFVNIQTGAHIDYDKLKLSTHLEDKGGYNLVLPLSENSLAIGYIPANIHDTYPNLPVAKVDQRGVGREGNIDCGAFQSGYSNPPTSTGVLNTENVSVYASHDILHIKGEGVERIAVYNICGRLEFMRPKEETINICHLQTGVYVALIYVQNQPQAFKFLKL